LKFLSSGIPVGAATPGRGTAEVPLLNRAADPTRGAEVYVQRCAVCHGANGAGKRNGSAVPPTLFQPIKETVRRLRAVSQSAEPINPTDLTKQ
jgi:cytochrome c